MKTFCISHVKDVDGIGAAAIVSSATGAGVLLSDYDTVVEDLAKVPAGIDQLVICDLGTSEATVGSFLDALEKLGKRCNVIYIDHHYASAETKNRIRKIGVKLVHNTRECSSILAFITFRRSLPLGAMKIALYGAVTDYMDSAPFASRLMEKTDRQVTLAEATLLSEAVARMGDEPGYPQMLVRELAMLKEPHRIDDVVAHAVEQLDRASGLAAVVKEKGVRLRRIAYMDTTEHATGNVAKMLIGTFDVLVGVSYREKQKGWCEVSLRSTSECRAHLGKTIGSIALKLGGSGGGHRLAAGCRIPTSRVPEMLRALDKRI